MKLKIIFLIISGLFFSGLFAQPEYTFVKRLVASTEITLGSATITSFSTDGTLTGATDAQLPTAFAVKTYADSRLDGIPIIVGTPTDGQILKYIAANSRWEFAADDGIASLTAASGVRLASNALALGGTVENTGTNGVPITTARYLNLSTGSFNVRTDINETNPTTWRWLFRNGLTLPTTNNVAGKIRFQDLYPSGNTAHLFDIYTGDIGTWLRESDTLFVSAEKMRFTSNLGWSFITPDGNPAGKMFFRDGLLAELGRIFAPSNNSFFAGFNSGQAWTAGANNNTAVGSSAGQSISTGDENTAVGTNALSAVSSGSQNTAVGYNSATTISTGIRNTAVGSSAGNAISTGNENTVVGMESGLSVSGGQGNTLLGALSGRLLTTGNNNVFIGINAGNVSGFGTSTSNRLVIDNAADATPFLSGDFSNNRLGMVIAAPRATFDVGNLTDAVILPSGTTAQRPGTPVAGMERFNATLNRVESYNGTFWAAQNLMDTVIVSKEVTWTTVDAANTGGSTTPTTVNRGFFRVPIEMNGMKLAAVKWNLAVACSNCSGTNPSIGLKLQHNANTGTYYGYNLFDNTTTTQLAGSLNLPLTVSTGDLIRINIAFSATTPTGATGLEYTLIFVRN